MLTQKAHPLYLRNCTYVHPIPCLYIHIRFLLRCRFCCQRGLPPPLRTGLGYELEVVDSELTGSGSVSGRMLSSDGVCPIRASVYAWEKRSISRVGDSLRASSSTGASPVPMLATWAESYPCGGDT